ncbi:brefeldin A resistance protein [Chaetomium fimeti]|uniref:Brefeldin A resistance protein n=1 Tax=Chaetomium fimeti TaxID=1854472 RepID=A0AAE0LRK5_9PEZI|nr:brefeldin A resistance protein [Chaetomium fimeti]
MPGSSGSMTASEGDQGWPLQTIQPKGDHLPDPQPRRLGITWENLTVKAVAADATVHDNFLSQYNVAQKLRDVRRKPALKTILDSSHGCVKPGEMLLVLGRPGSGCTTLLSTLVNRRQGYSSVEGDVHYGSIPAADAGQYHSQIVMNTEEELFFPSLTVDQTMDFATRLKLPFDPAEDSASREKLRKETRDFLLESMGISHTHSTKLGNEFIRGVSGGERKRVSIVECMATRGSVFCWDNSTRGLDASNALEWAKSVRTMTDALGLASIATLYQAGNGIYNLFDKVLVLDGGKQIYYGPTHEARPFMEALGFICQEGANVADFLTGVTVPTERRIQPGREVTFPRTADELKAQYEASTLYPRMREEYSYPKSDFARENTRAFREDVATEKHRLPKDSALTVSFPMQVMACVVRQYQIVWGDKATFILKQAFTMMQAVIMGSLFYQAPENSGGLFVKGGALFFSLLYNSLLSMSEVTSSFDGRPILVKHKLFGFYHPAAFCIAQIAADIPLILLQVSGFGVILYFMVGFTMTASAFFTYWIVLVAGTMCMTALFRAIGASFADFNSAAKISGLSITTAMMYTGYMIQKPQMHPWFVWLYWINPIAYAFDALLSNEFHGRVIECSGNSLVPNGPGYNDPAHQSCAGVTGSTQGQTSLTGDDYLGALTYSQTHIWRNVGIVMAWWALYVTVTVVATMRWRAASDAGSTLLIPRERSKLVPAELRDEEAAAGDKSSPSAVGDPEAAEKVLIKNTSLFTWKDLSYTVKTPEGERLLLDNVQGWVKPGMLGALMGSSGAGKTTLLDVLAQRKTDGTIRGSIQVDGRPLPISFQRSAGYCEQLDVHEPFATVREALEFSALLRQRRDVPREEKLRYVDTIIDLLELNDLADTLIGQPGAGLTIEQRKRVTIGVELVAKPSILIFLDEPTSGLDGQSAYNTVRFLRKLADVGQAVLVTIHQPSAQVFSVFDTLLLLAGGGKTVYFGDIGESGRTVREYFDRYGAPCPDETNLAEHMIDVVSGSLSQGKDWSQVWLASPEHAAVTEELDQLVATAAASPPKTTDDGYEYATTLWTQLKMVTQRTSVSLYRNTDYINNKVALHTFGALFNGFTFWQIGDSVTDLQMRLFTAFNLIFVAPGVINQLQPLFIQRRNIFETREKKSKMYSWVAFVTGLVVSEIPYLCICAVLYFFCWYYTVGFPHDTSRAGSIFFVLLMFEFIYTGIGQFEAACAPNELFAALINPIVIGTLMSFCGVLVPYAQIQAFWRYWLYWLNPFNYLMGSILVFAIWDTDVTCSAGELALFDPAVNGTCGEYLADYLQGMGRGARLLNPDATSRCEVCPYRDGSVYLQALNLNEYYYGWRDAGIVVIFALSSYALVYLMMKLRTKTSKKAQ